MGKVRIAIGGRGQLRQFPRAGGWSTTRTLTMVVRVSRPHACPVRGRTTSATSRWSPRSTWTPRRSAPTSPEAINASRERTTPSRSPRCRPTGVDPCQARGRPWTALGEVLPGDHHRVRRARSRTWSRRCVTPAPTSMVCYLPGRLRGTRPSFYARCAIEAHVAFVNALPVFIASNPEWAAKFTEARACRSSATTSSPRSAATITQPRAGQAVRGPRGSELLPHLPAELRRQHGLHEHAGAQSGSQSKKISKTQAVTSQIPHEMERASVHIGPVRPRGRGWNDRKDGPTSGSRAARSATCRLNLGVQARGMGTRPTSAGRRHHRRGGARAKIAPGPGASGGAG